MPQYPFKIGERVIICNSTDERYESIVITWEDYYTYWNIRNPGWITSPNQNDHDRYHNAIFIREINNEDTRSYGKPEYFRRYPKPGDIVVSADLRYMDIKDYHMTVISWNEYIHINNRYMPNISGPLEKSGYIPVRTIPIDYEDRHGVYQLQQPYYTFVTVHNLTECMPPSAVPIVYNEPVIEIIEPFHFLLLD